MLLYSLDGRKGGGSILSKDKAVRANGTEPLDYGKDTGEDLLFSSSDRQSATDFRESSVRVLTYLKSNRPGTGLWGENSASNLFVGGTYSGTTVLTAIPPKSSSTDVTSPRQNAGKWKAIWPSSMESP